MQTEEEIFIYSLTNLFQFIFHMTRQTMQQKLNAWKSVAK